MQIQLYLAAWCPWAQGIRSQDQENNEKLKRTPHSKVTRIMSHMQEKVLEISLKTECVAS